MIKLQTQIGQATVVLNDVPTEISALLEATIYQMIKGRNGLITKVETAEVGLMHTYSYEDEIVEMIVGDLIEKLA